MSTQTLGDVIINMRANDVNMSAGLSNVAHTIDHLREHIMSFEGLLHIGFGTSAARAIFHGLHHGILEVGEGFREAQEHGLGFAASLGDGLAKVLGMRSAVEEIKEHEKQAAEAAKEHADAIDRQIKLARERRDLGKSAARDLGEGKERGLSEIGAPDVTPSSEAQTAIRKYDDAIDKLSDQIRDADRAQKTAFAKFSLPGIKGEDVDKAQKEFNTALQQSTDLRRQRNKLEQDREQTERVAFANKIRDDQAAAAKKDLKDSQDQDKYWDEVTKFTLKQAEEQGKRNEEEDKKKSDEAWRIVERNNPLEAIKGQAIHAQRLFEGGFLTAQERDQEFDRLKGQFSEKDSQPQRAKFMGLEQMARSVQESIGKEKPEKTLPTLQSIDKTLSDIKNNPKTAVLG